MFIEFCFFSACGSECLTMRCVAAQLPLETVNITNTTDAIQKIIDLSPPPPPPPVPPPPPHLSPSPSRSRSGVGGGGASDESADGVVGKAAASENDEHDLCNRLHKFYHCLLNLVNEDCLINRVYVSYFNEIESRLREFKCKQTSGNKNRKFYYYFKTRFYSSEFNDDEDDALDGKL